MYAETDNLMMDENLFSVFQELKTFDEMNDLLLHATYFDFSFLIGRDNHFYVITLVFEKLNTRFQLKCKVSVLDGYNGTHTVISIYFLFFFKHTLMFN
jgi:hypothetical protein